MSVRDYNATPSSNTTISSIDIAEGCSPSGINNAIRQQMADLKDVSTGAVALESPKFDSILDGNIKATDASGTDTAGTATTIKGGAGTGTGAGGSIIFQVADGAGSTGSSVNAHATAMTITDDGNVDIGGSLLVDTINEKTTGNGVNIPGHVVQVVNATITSGSSTTSSTFQDTSLTASITPSSSSNKILIITNASAWPADSSTQSAITVFRGNASTGTNLGHSLFGFGSAANSAGASKGNISVNYLDSPATTSSQTYTVALASTNNVSAAYISINNETSTLTLMEIAQ